MSPFHDLGRRCGGPPRESAPPQPWPGLAGQAERRAAAKIELQFNSLRRFVRLLPLGVVGLAGLHSRGIGGVVRVQSSALRVSRVESRGLMGASRHQEMEYSRALYMPPNHGGGAIRRTGADDEDED